MRLIDVDALKDWSEIVPLTGDGGIDINDFDEKLKSMPTVDAVPVKHGKWLKAYGDHEAFGIRPFYRYCSCCNEATVFTYNYCPNCGARMDEE